MNPRLPRILLGCLIGLVFVALGAALFDWYVKGVPDLMLFLRIGLSLLGLAVLYEIAPRPGEHAAGGPKCGRCGSRTYETRRSLDRRLMTTCFACGAESTVLGPAPDVRRIAPRA